MKTPSASLAIAVLALSIVPVSTVDQASIDGIQDAYKAVCQWSVDALSDMTTSKRPGSEARWGIRVKSVKESVEDKTVQIRGLPIVAKGIKADLKAEGASRAATYTVSASIPLPRHL